MSRNPKDAQRSEKGRYDMKFVKQEKPPQQLGLSTEGLRRLRDAADPGNPHSYEWYVIENINTPEERMERTTSLEEAIRTYTALNTEDKRLGVTKDDIAAVDIIIRHGGREWISEDRLKRDSVRSDPTVAAAVTEIQSVLAGCTPTQGMAANRKEDD